MLFLKKTILEVGIRGNVFRIGNVDTLAREELTGEGVAVVDAVNHAVNS